MSIINLTDSYKFSHFKQYPDDIETIYSYMEARGGDESEIVFFGLKYYIEKYLTKRVTLEDIEEVEELVIEHGLPFNRKGWLDIVMRLDGKLPIRIDALPENTIANIKEPLFTISNTEPGFHWLVGHLETLLMKVWYPCSVATRARSVKQMLTKHWYETVGHLNGLDFAFHNFGDRGSTSVEAAAIGGVAHLTQFKGTDNFNAILMQKKYYANRYMGYSIPATEHSTVTSWGRDKEFDMYENYVETFKDSPMIACVIDSYDYMQAIGYINKTLKVNPSQKFIIRPDSGDPVRVIDSIVCNLDVPESRNAAGYLEYENFRIIYGDGIDMNTMRGILDIARCHGVAASNFAFGSGGWLMQQLNRDTHQFAIKASAAKLKDGSIREIYKDPIGCEEKKSKRGIQTNSRYITVFENGESKYDY